MVLYGLVALAVAGAGMALLTVVTAERPARPIPDLDGYLARWAPLHGGHDPRSNRWLLGWLRLSFVIARPLARRGIKPDVLTLWSVWLALAVFVPAAAGGHWPILAGWLLVVSGLFDTIDGCVAVLTDRATRFGYVLDSVVDRVNDVIYLVAVVAVGGWWPLALAAGIGAYLIDYIRARSANAGGSEVGTVTLGERANRVILTAVGIHFGGVLPGFATEIATLALGMLALFCVVGVVQIVVAVHRELSGPAT